MPFSTEARNAMLNALLGTGSASGLWASLHTADPEGSASAAKLCEVFGAGYGRQQLNLSAANAGSKGLASFPSWNVPSGMTLTHVAYWRVSTGGSQLDFVGAAPLDAPIDFPTAGVFTLTDELWELSAEGGTGTRKATWQDLGVWVGVAQPSTPCTFDQWVANPSAGYWAWIDLSVLSIDKQVSAVAFDMRLRTGIPVVVAQSAGSASVVAPAGSLPLTAVAPTDVLLVQSLTPPSSTITLTATAPNARVGFNVTAPAVSIVLTGTAPTSTVNNPSSVSVSPPASSLAVTSTAPGVAVSGGGGATVSDNFDRANDASLGANWTTITGFRQLCIVSNTASGTAGSPTSTDQGAYWSADNFAADQSSECIQGTGDTNGSTNGTMGVGPAVRISDSAATFYAALWFHWDDGESAAGEELGLFKCVSGTWTQIQRVDSSGYVSTPLLIKLEVSGTTLTVKTATSHAGTWTTRITQTDSAIASGRAGIVLRNSTANSNVNDWYGGPTA